MSSQTSSQTSWKRLVYVCACVLCCSFVVVDSLAFVSLSHTPSLYFAFRSSHSCVCSVSLSSRFFACDVGCSGSLITSRHVCTPLSAPGCHIPFPSVLTTHDLGVMQRTRAHSPTVWRRPERRAPLTAAPSAPHATLPFISMVPRASVCACL